MPEPMTCVNPECDRCGVQILSGAPNCRECMEPLWPYRDVEFIDEAEGHDFADETPGQRTFGEMVDGMLSRIAPAAADDDTFRCPSDLTGCPISSRAVVEIPVELFDQWVFLARNLDTEWIAYLTGEMVGEGHYRITGMYFPEQFASAGSCEAKDGEIRDGTVAAVHSHVGMNAFFSTEDANHFNHPIEMVVNRDGDLLANGRVRLECGRYHRGTATVKFVNCEHQMDLLEDLRAKITRYGLIQ